MAQMKLSGSPSSPSAAVASLPSLPSEVEADVEQLDQYLQDLAADEEVLHSELMSDFLAANWDGKELNFLQSLPDFLYMLTKARVPAFMPEPPKIGDDAYLAEESPFEVYVYLQAFRHEDENTEEYLDFFYDYCQTTPEWENPDAVDALDEADVVHPGQPGGEVPIPYHYNHTYVHFLPGGYLDGHNVRISYLGKSKFSFLVEDTITEWVTDLHGDREPKRILDFGSGGCFSTFVYGEVFPEAEVVGVDLAPPFVRFCRQWAEDRGAGDNVQFYQGNAESLPMYEDGSFDIINYAYVLHEMPAENAKLIIDEMYRLLAPGGVLNGFEVPYFESAPVRDYVVEMNTWGYDWEVQGNQGPEPYTGEYEYGTVLPEALERAGFVGVDVIPYSFFESVFLAYKEA